MRKPSLLLLITLVSLCPAETLSPTDDAPPPPDTQKEEVEFIPWEAVHEQSPWRIRYSGNQPGRVTPDGSQDPLCSDGDIPNSAFPNRITLENTATGATYLFTPEDAADVESSAFYIPQAWSPDGRRCILPNGRFEGFILLQPGSERPGEMRRVCLHAPGTDTDTGLWHRFVRWDGPDAFIFCAGLSGDEITFRYDLSTETYTTVDPQKAYFLSRTKLITTPTTATLTRQ